MEAFSPKLYQWERDYFKDNILAGQAYDRGVHQEMESLAKELLAQPAVTVHRDFQSQNILVKNQEAWMIDFQGLRTGCAFYDFASLAFDPYLTRPDMDLWRIEIEDHAREASEWAGSRDEFTHLLHVAATQRLLQACGAYGFLGKKQNLPQYLAHLPQGLKNLRVAASLTGRRKLAQLAEDLAAKLTSR
jgi:aminoglycoside/choline kinase family phosphotransferase